MEQQLKCPDCGSTNISSIDGAAEPQARCDDCGATADKWLFGPLPSSEKMWAEAEYRTFCLAERPDYWSCTDWVDDGNYSCTREVSFRQPDGTIRWATFAVCFDVRDTVLFAGFTKEADANAFGRQSIPAGRAARAQSAFNEYQFSDGLDVENHVAWDYSNPQRLTKRVTLASKMASSRRQEVTFEVCFSSSGDVIFAGVAD